MTLPCYMMTQGDYVVKKMWESSVTTPAQSGEAQKKYGKVV